MPRVALNLAFVLALYPACGGETTDGAASDAGVSSSDAASQADAQRDAARPSDSGAPRWIGASCTSAADCAAIPDGVCVANYPGGMCSTPCDTTCPQRGDQRAVCVKTSAGTRGMCFPTCQPRVGVPCRTEYACCNTLSATGGMGAVCV